MKKDNEKKETIEVNPASTTEIYEEFQKGYEFLVNNEFIKNADIALKFYYGDQWEKSKNKNIPRAVFNLCKLQINNKLANITSVKTSLMFYTNKTMQDTSFVTNFVKYLLKEMNHEQKRISITRDSLIKSTGISHIYYDPDKLGVFGDYEGGIREEILNMKNVVVANPYNKDLQSQKYIIIKSRKTVGTLKKMCKNKELHKFIVPENKENEFLQDVKDSDLCYTYLKYFRIDGEVYHTLATKNVIIYENIALNPDLNKIDDKKEKIDEEQARMPQEKIVENDIKKFSKIKFFRYPVAFLSLNEHDESIYGVSELKDVIALQKFFNQLYSMQLLNVINTAWDKYIVDPNALRNQIINDESGQVLVDYSKTGNGIKRLGGMNSMANGVVQLAGDAFNLFRSLNQISDLYTGQTENKDIAASAIAQLNSQADKPIDLLRQRLWAFEEEIGQIIEMFIRHYYHDYKFRYELSEKELMENNNTENKFKNEVFEASNYDDVEFYVYCEAIQSFKDTEIIRENLVQSLILNGTLTNMNVHDRELYIELSPLTQTIKDKLKVILDRQKNDDISQLQAQIQQLMAQNQQLVNTLQRAKQGIDYLNNINKSTQASYKNEVKAHQDDIKIRDDAAQQILTKNVEKNNNSGIM